MKDKFSHSPTKDMSTEVLNIFSDLIKVSTYGLGTGCAYRYGLGTGCAYSTGWGLDVCTGMGRGLDVLTGMDWGLDIHTGMGWGLTRGYNLFTQAQSYELSMWEMDMLSGLQTDIVSLISYAEKTKRVCICVGCDCMWVCEVCICVGVHVWYRKTSNGFSAGG